MAQKSALGQSGATAAGDAHEDGDGNANDDTSVDQQNNAIGRELASSNGGKADCYSGVMHNINTGSYAR